MFKINIAVNVLNNNNEYNFVNFYENINSHYQLLTSFDPIKILKDQLNINKKNEFQIEHFNISNYAIKKSVNNIDNTLNMACLK